ncbi:MAG: GTPase Era [Erysipelotrichaceae bacterium]|nr:GTPase Era [Erysipelotrichaceae bacterium]MBQ6591957.1 GTPase Era [Solobacterium sp.]
MKSGFVALVGRPNAGKSTLLNALMKQKVAIVSDKPQTTRSEIRGILNLEDAQIVFTDTPGIHKPEHLLGSRMNKEASNVMQGVDLIYLVSDGSVPFSRGDEFVLRMVKQSGIPAFLIFNKIDRMKKEDVLHYLELWQKKHDFAEFFPVSALKQESYEDLIRTTLEYLPEGEPFYPRETLTDAGIRFRIGEIIREKILMCTEEEVPHASAVYVETLKTKKESAEVGALILVEKQGQKGIMIGKQGAMLKKIGTMARPEIEALLGKRVYLSLYVRVEEEWRDRDKLITEYGYGNIDE